MSVVASLRSTGCVYFAIAIDDGKVDCGNGQDGEYGFDVEKVGRHAWSEL